MIFNIEFVDGKHISLCADGFTIDSPHRSSCFLFIKNKVEDSPGYPFVGCFKIKDIKQIWFTKGDK